MILLSEDTPCQFVSIKQAKQFLRKSSFVIAQENTEQMLRINFSLEIEQLMKIFRSEKRFH